MKRLIKTEGIILRKRNLLNKDKIVTIFTAGIGRIQVIAKGVRKITSRRLPHLETGNLIKAEIYRKHDRFYLQGSSLISGFYKIKNNQAKHKYLYFYLYVLNKLLAEEQSEEAIFNMLKSFLSSLSETDFGQKDRSHYLNKLLLSLGFIKQEEPFEKLRSVIEDIINEKLPEKLL